MTAATDWMGSLATRSPGGGPSVFAHIGVLLRRLLAPSQGHPELLRAVAAAIAEFGPVVLAAEDLEDLDERIEAVLDDPRYATSNTDIARVFFGAALAGFQPGAGASEEIAAVVGDGQLDLVREADAAVLQTFLALRRLLAKSSADELKRLVDSRVVPSVADVLDAELPVAVSRVFLAGLKAGVASLAIGEAARRGEPLEPWLARALCQCACDGARAQLVLFASMPAADVPTSVVALSDRLDLHRLRAEHSQAMRVSREQLASARASGADVHPTPRRPH